MDGTLNRSQRYYDAYQEIFPSVISNLLEETLAVSNARIQEGRKAVKEGFTNLVKHMGIDIVDFFSKMAESLPFNELIEKDEKLKAMLMELKGKSLSLALLSDTGRPVVESVVRALGIEGIFDVVVTSNEAGLKPDPLPYLSTLARLDIPPNEIIYVGDRYEMEIKVAKDLDMTTILLDPSDSQNRQPKASYRIKSIYSIPGLITKIRRQIGYTS